MNPLQESVIIYTVNECFTLSVVIQIKMLFFLAFLVFALNATVVAESSTPTYKVYDKERGKVAQLSDGLTLQYRIIKPSSMVCQYSSINYWLASFPGLGLMSYWGQSI